MVSPELREKVVAYLDGKITLAELERWYVPRVPRFFKDPDSADADIIAAIDLGLAELHDRIRTESAVRELIASALREYDTVRVKEKEPALDDETGTSAQTTHDKWSVSSSVRARSVTVKSSP